MKLKLLACHTRAHCQACLTDPDWLERVTGVRDFDRTCGVTLDDLPEPAKPEPKPPGPGDRFHAILMRKYSITPCAKCVEMIDRMNDLGVEGCHRDRVEILNEIWERRDQLKGWRHIAAKLPGSRALALRELNGLLSEALRG